ncbi:hypothetical protein BGX23_001492 [Mortierella sp. AD031]|nr:hypothetical protein BGX23_001492 [Mortierella sp. AD031]
MDVLGGSTKRISSDFPLGTPQAAAMSKKSRPKSFSSMVLLSDQKVSSPQPRLPHQSKATRWANRGGIGANEMMVDLETTGVFVPSNGCRLRAEFVYHSVIQCSDEIRHRGLLHPNIFTNPSPKKVISAMIALMIDQQRCDLFAIQCLRIDTVTGLMLNLMSQMSNPIIPYAITEHYFQRNGLATRSSSSQSPPSSRRQSGVPRPSPEQSQSPQSVLGDSLPVIPELPLKTWVPFNAAYAWAREYFDLHTFLALLPSMNRVILLEVLHLCHELLDHQIQNRLTITRLVQQIAPALFRTVFDQKILESIAGGSRRCSVYGDSISSLDGTRAENHLFMIILVRFLHLSSNNYGASTADPSLIAFRNAISDQGSLCSMHNVEPLGRHATHVSQVSSSSSVGASDYEHSNGAFRKSQQWHQQEQQDHYQRMERFFQKMEILQLPSHHFGYHPANQDQATQHRQHHHKSHSSSSVNVNDLDISRKVHNPLRSPSQDANTGAGVNDDFTLPGPILESDHRDHTWHGRRQDQGFTIVM